MISAPLVHMEKTAAPNVVAKMVIVTLKLGLACAIQVGWELYVPIDVHQAPTVLNVANNVNVSTGLHAITSLAIVNVLPASLVKHALMSVHAIHLALTAPNFVTVKTRLRAIHRRGSAIAQKDGQELIARKGCARQIFMVKAVKRPASVIKTILSYVIRGMDGVSVKQDGLQIFVTDHVHSKYSNRLFKIIEFN